LIFFFLALWVWTGFVVWLIHTRGLNFGQLGIFFGIIWLYLGAHILFGPLDWYLIYKFVKKKKEKTK